MSALDAALRYHALGWSVIPMRMTKNKTARDERQRDAFAIWLLKADGEGFESIALTSCVVNDFERSQNRGKAESEAFCGDENLRAVIDAWPALPEAIKLAIMAILSAAARER